MFKVADHLLARSRKQRNVDRYRKTNDCERKARAAGVRKEGDRNKKGIMEWK
jgi:hypothetical protein